MARARAIAMGPTMVNDGGFWWQHDGQRGDGGQEGGHGQSKEEVAVLASQGRRQHGG